MIKKNYSKLWLVFVNIIAKKGFKFIDLIDIDKNISSNFIGAWANILIKADSIYDALQIVPIGLNELGFEIVNIDKIENILSKVENNEIKKDVIKEGDWLLKSDFVFKISDKIFPYEDLKK
jgi:hypothetical protein